MTFLMKHQSSIGLRFCRLTCILIGCLMHIHMVASSASAQSKIRKITIGAALHGYYGEKMPTKELYTFGSDGEADDAVERIVKATGLEPNFVVETVSDGNAAAALDESGEQRLLLYNPTFMEEVEQETGNRWAGISIMAHEIGHHLQGHTITGGGSKPLIELEADKFSGFVLGKLGAELKDAQAAMKLISSEKGSATHPPKKDRLAAIAVGFRDAKITVVGGCDMIKLSWDVVKDTKDEGELGKFITDFEKCPGTGSMVERARNVLAELRKPEVAPPPTRKRPGERFQDCDECPWMVVLPGGSFLMGSPKSEEGRYDNEGPVHGVTIPEAFAVGEYEVTREEYGAYVADTGRSSGGSCRVWTGSEWEARAGLSWRDPGYAQTGRDPVVCVSWEEAREYVGWLSRKTGKEYRLLSEAEWEYAARAGSVTRFSYGDDLKYERLCGYGNGADWTVKEKYSGWTVAPCRDGYVNTAPVGRYKRNGFGLYDMHGNAWEWVQDCWNGSYRGALDDGRAWESGDCNRRVLRGGSWSNYPWALRSASRFWVNSGLRINYFGFRVGRTLTP